MKQQRKLSTAINMASHFHYGQFDKGGTPYILHCIKVMQNLNSDDEELNCIAILHDVLEDTHCTIQFLRSFKSSGMSDRIIKGVVALTKKNAFKTIGDYLAWQEIYQTDYNQFDQGVPPYVTQILKNKDDVDYIMQILKNKDAIKVKLADLKHNSDITRLKGLTDKDFERMKKYYKMFDILKKHIQ